MNTSDPIFVAGHGGLVGSALVRRLQHAGFTNLITRTHAELDLRDQRAVTRFFQSERPAYVFLAAAKVGGILANDRYPADFIRDNLQIQTNAIAAAHEAGVARLLFLGSSCVYPKHAPQPMKEEHLLTSELEPTNEAYAIAKIAGLKMCRAYRRQFGREYVSVMPTNLYGPGDNFDLETSHVLAALIRKFHDAKVSGTNQVTVWGTGRPRREFLHVDDAADACLFVMLHDRPPDLVNVGWGKDISIAELAQLIGEIVGFTGEIVYDPSKPDGTPRKLLDTSRLSHLGWSPRISLREGIESTYAWYAGREKEFSPPSSPSTQSDGRDTAATG
jgi:GDP-L-fucose synthase